jgi:hypothetical protein
MRKISLFLTLLLSFSTAISQINPDTVKAGKFDNGKMWTFDFPPLDYFEKTYGFRPTQQWLDDVRMSALRFANYCSASFVSADGLVMTNHHCARESGTSVQRDGEDLNKSGFLASTLADERKVAGLYVDQLVKIEEITQRVQKSVAKGKTDEEKVQMRNQEFEAIKKEYAAKGDWKGLELQTISFYWGGKFSLYGFKRYNDVRLVAMPELALGFFGGDYDNFTYPRYCLDFSFFRVYGEDGKPLKTPNYFKFNPDGPKEGENVFVIGNPGSTNRQATTSILEYFRDRPWPTAIKRFSARSQILQKFNEREKNDSIGNEIFGFENSLKAIGGMLEGIKDPYIMARRMAFEKEFKSEVAANGKIKSQLRLWDDIASTQNEIKQNYYDATLLAPSGLNSDAYDLATVLHLYAAIEKSDPKRADQMKQFITDYKKPYSMELEQRFLAQHVREVFEFLGPADPYVRMLKDVGSKAPKREYPQNMNADEAENIASALLSGTKIYDKSFLEELLLKGGNAITASADPMLVLGRSSSKKYEAAAAKNRQLGARLTALRSNLALLLFEVYGTAIPPDATFSLRIADGIVKGYQYNGTYAPYKTTFFGLYDRYYSFNKNYPWDLPEKWRNPPTELLDEPMNFISTNDIIGGNSGSPMINQKKEVVGLIFDGNMESLPGNYIFMPESNRTVSVHAGGIIAAMKYIYKSERIVNELVGAK